MLSVMLVCWALCLAAYGALYYTYPRDRLRQRGAAAAGGLGGGRAGFGSGELMKLMKQPEGEGGSGMAAVVGAISVQCPALALPSTTAAASALGGWGAGSVCQSGWLHMC
jgi:hypothetical protein